LGVETVCSVRLKIISGDGEEDQVVRKERFLERHPDVRIYSDPATLLFRADIHATPTAGYYLLKDLLDFLERVLELS
jgi:hypothetical protein